MRREIWLLAVSALVLTYVVEWSLMPTKTLIDARETLDDARIRQQEGRSGRNSAADADTHCWEQVAMARSLIAAQAMELHHLKASSLDGAVESARCQLAGDDTSQAEKLEEKKQDGHFIDSDRSHTQRSGQQASPRRRRKHANVLCRHAPALRFRVNALTHQLVVYDYLGTMTRRSFFKGQMGDTAFDDVIPDEWQPSLDESVDGYLSRLRVDVDGGLSRPLEHGARLQAKLDAAVELNMPLPPVDSSYFQHITLFMAVVSSRMFDDFVGVELGSGWGRWLTLAAKAVHAVDARSKLHHHKQSVHAETSSSSSSQHVHSSSFKTSPTHESMSAGRRVKLIGVEGEPTHFQFMKTHFRDNGMHDACDTIPSDDETCESGIHLLHMAATGVRDDEDLLIGQEVDMIVGRADRWYGQQVATIDQVRQHAHELPTARVKRVSLPRLLQHTARVDWLQIDTSNNVYEIVESSIHVVNDKVRFLVMVLPDEVQHKALRHLLREHGWYVVFDFNGSGQDKEGNTIMEPVIHHTDYGVVPFHNGLLVMLNMRLVSIHEFF